MFLITWITVHLTGRRRYALIAGCLAALYGPELLFESMVLRESTFVFVALLAFAVLLNARKRHFSTGWLIISGAAAFLPLLVRFSGLLWAAAALLWTLWYCCRKNTTSRELFRRKGIRAVLKTAIPLAAGGIIILIPPTIYHAVVFQYPSPTRMNLNYVFKTSGTATQSINQNQQPKPKQSVCTATEKCRTCPFTGLLTRSGNFAKNFLTLFSPYEMPNNINYYFLKHKLFPLSLLIGPLLLIPLGLTGLLLALLKNPFRDRYGLMLLYLIAYALPVALYLPLARLRLILFPAFCFFTPYVLVFLKEKLERHEPDRMVESRAGDPAVCAHPDTCRPGTEIPA